MIKVVMNHSEIKWTYCLIVSWIILIAFSHLVYSEQPTNNHCIYGSCVQNVEEVKAVYK